MGNKTKSVVITFSSPRMCWLPARVLSDCLGCDRYNTCTYPERRHHQKYEANRQMRKLLAEQVAALDDEAHKLLRG